MLSRRFFVPLIALGIAALACASLGSPAAPAVGAPGSETPPIPSEFVPTAIPITPTYEGCAYMWGSQQLPALSSKLNTELQKINMDATGLAYAYGENCVYGDGHQTFSAMETDYRVGVKVKNVHDEAALGDWIFKVMEVILDLPPEEIQGPQPGRVDFDFKQPDPAELHVNVPIDRYRSEATGLKGAELFRLFYTNP